MPSYSPVFSQAFVQYTASTPNASFEVPAGFTAVVRQVSGWQDVGGYVLQLLFQDSEAAPSLTVASIEADGVANYAATEGRWALDEGGIMTIQASTLGATSSFYVGGYLLRNVLT